MKKNTAHAKWNGDLLKGNGSIKLGSGAFEGQFSFTSRFENGTGTNPEEMLAGAHAGCFSMALSFALTQAGYNPLVVETNSEIFLDKTEAGFEITKIHLFNKSKVEGIDAVKFAEIAEGAKSGCVVSKALTGVKIELTAELI